MTLKTVTVKIWTGELKGEPNTFESKEEPYTFERVFEVDISSNAYVITAFNKDDDGSTRTIFPMNRIAWIIEVVTHKDPS